MSGLPTVFYAEQCFFACILVAEMKNDLNKLKETVANVEVLAATRQRQLEDDTPFVAGELATRLQSGEESSESGGSGSSRAAAC